MYAFYVYSKDEDLESIQMGYVSFSENRISRLHVFEYILYLTLKGREPRIQDVSIQLSHIQPYCGESAFVLVAMAFHQEIGSFT